MSVHDEIENALGYYQTTFLQQISQLYAELEDQLGGLHVASFFRMSSWIGGDRDGNPNVNAKTLILALRRQCDVVLRHYLSEIHLLGANSPSPSGLSAAHRSCDDEPYRRALIGIYAKLSATLLALTGGEAERHAVSSGEPYRDADALQADLGIIEASLAAHHGKAMIAARLAPLRRAVFGFHLATIDLRQSSDRHEETLAELLAAARVSSDYGSLDEASKQALLPSFSLFCVTRGRCAFPALPIPNEKKNWRSSKPREACSAPSASRRSGTTSSAIPKRSATSSKCSFCKKNAA